MNAILIDDETVALNALHRRVDWSKYGIREVFLADSMQSAQELFSGHPIDIMISDIEMPRGSGLDLYEWVKIYYPHVECIYVTCHPDFAYLRKMRTSTRNIIVSDFLDYILSARYLALIREERGGAYHVGYTTVIPENPSHPWRGVVQFKTRPDILETVIEDVPAVMKKMCEEGPTEAEMEMAARYLLKRHTELDARAERSVGTQLDRLEDTVLLGRDYDVDYKNVIGSITAREVQKMARYFAGGDILKEIYTER